MAFRYVPPEKFVSFCINNSVENVFPEINVPNANPEDSRVGIFFFFFSFLTPKAPRSFDECEDSVEVITGELFHLLSGGRKVSGT